LNMEVLVAIVDPRYTSACLVRKAKIVYSIESGAEKQPKA